MSLKLQRFEHINYGTWFYMNRLVCWSNAVEWSGVGWGGVEGDRVEWSGVGWSGGRWDGVEWSGVEWDRVEWSGVG